MILVHFPKIRVICMDDGTDMYTIKKIHFPFIFKIVEKKEEFQN